MPKSGGKFPTRTYGQVIELEFVDGLKKLNKPRKHFAYQIDVSWTDSAVRRVYRSYDQVYEFYCSLCAMTKDGGMAKLSGKRTFERSSTEAFALKHVPEIKCFVQSLLHLPSFMQKSDVFLWFWEPSSEDVKNFDIDKAMENSKYPRPSATVLSGGTVLVAETQDQDYICVCTTLSSFSGIMPSEHSDRKGLAVKEGDVIYVLRMSNCPTGYWMVRNVFGSEGMVPITALRVDQDIIQRNKKRRSQRLQQQKRLEMVKSAENLADRSQRIQQLQRLEMMKSADNIADRRRSGRKSGGAPFSPPLSRTLRELNNCMQNMQYPEPNPYSRRRSGRYNESLTSTSCIVSDDRQVTHDLIKSLHETSLMLQERIAMSDMVNRSQHIASAASNSSAYFVRSPTKRGVRVSARFKRMTPSPSKFISPCRKGIKGLRIAAPSPLASEASPSQNMTFEKSPVNTRKRTPSTEGSASFKKTCTEEDAGKMACAGEEDSGASTNVEVSLPNKPRRRSEIARRVSLRLKQVYGKSPKKSPKRRTVRRQSAIPKPPVVSA